MMRSFAFFLKTYRGDMERARNLVNTFNKYNVESIHLFIMCPKEDLCQFDFFRNDDITILVEENIKTEVFEENNHWTMGYLNQEIFKLAFWELGLCENYQCLDSDAIFIRPFHLKDFMYDEHTPYTVLIEDKDLKSDCYYSKEYWIGRRELIKRIEDTLDYHPYKLLTCHGFQVFNRVVLQTLKEEFLTPKGYSYKTIISISPYEFSWYNLWLQKTRVIPIHVCEPNFKTLHLKQHHINEVLRGMTLEHWSNGYLGIVINSNYGVGNGNYEDMSVYNERNSEIPRDIIEKNYRFYRRLFYRGMLYQLVRHLEKARRIIEKKCR